MLYDSLDVSSNVLTTLKDVSRIPAVPLLAQAAEIALDIIRVAQVGRLLSCNGHNGTDGEYRTQDKIKSNF